MTKQAIEDDTKVADVKEHYGDGVASTQPHSKSQVFDADSMATAIAPHVPYTLPIGKSSTQVTTTATPVSPFPATIDELIKLRAEEAEGTSPIVSYPSKGLEYTDYTPQQLDIFTTRAAAHYASIITPRLRSSDPVQVIGLLGPSRFEYYVTLLALSRLGHTVLFLSTRISEEAHANLLQKTGATTLLYDDKSFQHMAQALSARMSKLQVARICHSEVFTSSSSREDLLSKTVSRGRIQVVQYLTFDSNSLIQKSKRATSPGSSTLQARPAFPSRSTKLTKQRYGTTPPI